jgi:hypothetical protein
MLELTPLALHKWRAVPSIVPPFALKILTEFPAQSLRSRCWIAGVEALGQIPDEIVPGLVLCPSDRRSAHTQSLSRIRAT